MQVRDFMSKDPVCCNPESPLGCGIVSQADIAHVGSEKIAGELLKEVSRPTSIPSRVGGA